MGLWRQLRGTKVIGAKTGLGGGCSGHERGFCTVLEGSWSTRRQRNIKTLYDTNDSAELDLSWYKKDTSKTSSFPPMSGVPEVAFVAVAAEVVRKLLGGRAGVEEICPKILQALNVVGRSWLTGHHGQ